MYPQQPSSNAIVSNDSTNLQNHPPAHNNLAHVDVNAGQMWMPMLGKCECRCRADVGADAGQI